MAKTLVDTVTESFCYMSSSHICASGPEHTQLCKMAPFTIHTKIIIHILANIWQKFWLIQLLMIFLGICLFHTHFYQMSKLTGFIRCHD